MRIFLYSRAFYPALGGVEQVGFLLARELVRRGHQVTVATDVRAEPGVDVGLDFEVLRGRSSASLALAARRADLVHSSGFSLRAYPIAATARRPLVVTHHACQAACLVGNGWHGGPRCGYRIRHCATLTAQRRGVAHAARQLIRHALGRSALRAAAANVAVSRFVQGLIRAPHGTVIYNCADSSVFNSRPEQRPGERFLYVGRFVAEKGVDVLLHAIAGCIRAGVPVALDLVGAGPLEGQYRQLVRELAIEGVVAFRGALRGPALADTMRESLAVVVPSSCDEAFGIAAAEAISCGRLALVSAAGGLPEVVQGLDCVAPAGDAEAWAQLLIRAREDTAWRERNERLLPALAERFTVDTFIREYLRAYETALGGGG